MGEHARFSPSSADRWMACPASVKLSENIEPTPPSVYALEGQRAHSLAEKVLKTQHTNTWTYLAQTGKEVESYGEKEQVTAIQTYVDFIREQITKGYSIVGIEKKLKINRDIWGTCDALLKKDKHLHVIDFKFGKGVTVEAQFSPQMRLYGYGAIKHFKKEDTGIKDVMLTIVQPRAYHPKGPIRSHVMRKKELVSWYKNDVLKSYEEAQAEEPNIMAGNHCRWCPAQPTCPELLHQAQKMAQTIYNKEEKPIEPQSLKAKEIETVLHFSRMFKSWVIRVEEYAMSLLSAGTTIPGFVLVPKRAVRKWSDQEKAEKLLKKLFKKEAYDHKIVSPAKVDALLKNPEYSKKENAKKIKKLDKLIIQESSGFNIALEREVPPTKKGEEKDGKKKHM